MLFLLKLSENIDTTSTGTFCLSLLTKRRPGDHSRGFHRENISRRQTDRQPCLSDRDLNIIALHWQYRVKSEVQSLSVCKHCIFIIQSSLRLNWLPSYQSGRSQRWEKQKIALISQTFLTKTIKIKSKFTRYYIIIFAHPQKLHKMFDKMIKWFYFL